MLQCLITDENIYKEIGAAIRNEKCIVVIGLGFGLPLQVPNAANTLPQSHLRELLRRMYIWCSQKGIIAQGPARKDFDKLFETGPLDPIRLKIEEYLTNPPDLQACLRDVLLYDTHNFKHYLYELLVKIPFSKYVTTNYDVAIEKVYPEIRGRASPRVVYKNSLADALKVRKSEPLILKLHGDVDHLESQAIGNRIATLVLPTEIVYPDTLRQLFSGSCVLFLGFEKEDPDLRGLQNQIDANYKCWVMFPEGHILPSDTEHRSEQEINVIQYANDDELVAFLKQIEKTANTPKPVEIYVSYAAEDEVLRMKLEKFLIPLRRQLSKHYAIDIWSGGKIIAGQVWEQEIRNHLAQADIILLLISNDFLISPIFDEDNKSEIDLAIERHKQKNACLIPVILRPCNWQLEPFAKLQVSPSKDLPVTRWEDADEAFTKIARDVQGAIKDLDGKLLKR